VIACLAAMNALYAHPRFFLGPLTIAASLIVVAAKVAFADPLPPVMQAVLDAHNAYRAKHCVPARDMVGRERPAHSELARGRRPPGATSDPQGLWFASDRAGNRR
jgi:hypothetical protein